MGVGHLQESVTHGGPTVIPLLAVESNLINHTLNFLQIFMQRKFIEMY